MYDLIGGVIVLIIGIVLFAISRALPPVANTVAYWLGILLSVIGVIIIVMSVLTGGLGYHNNWDLDVLTHPVLQQLQ